jgi:hypothetical protein
MLANWDLFVHRGPSAIKRVLLCTGAALIASLSIFIWYRHGQVSNDPLVVAREYREALLSGNVGEVYRLTDPHEFQMNGMTRDDVARFLKEWVQPRLIRVTDDSYEIYGTGSSGWQSFAWGVATADGRIPISIRVAKTDSGLRVVQPLSSLFVTFAAVKDNHLPAVGPDKLVWYAKNARRMAPVLARYHFISVQVDPNRGPMSIEQFASWNEERMRSGPRLASQTSAPH